MIHVRSIKCWPRTSWSWTGIEIYQQFHSLQLELFLYLRKNNKNEESQPPSQKSSMLFYPPCNPCSEFSPHLAFLSAVEDAPIKAEGAFKAVYFSKQPHNPANEGEVEISQDALELRRCPWRRNDGHARGSGRLFSAGPVLLLRKTRHHADEEGEVGLSMVRVLDCVITISFPWATRIHSTWHTWYVLKDSYY